MIKPESNVIFKSVGRKTKIEKKNSKTIESWYNFYTKQFTEDFVVQK